MIVGLTGGIGSGKTVAAEEFVRMGFHLIDADAVARDLVNSNREIRNAIQQSFGPGLFDSNNQLRRRKLGKIVFSDPKKLLMLNRIVWPSLIRNIKNKIDQIQSKDTKANIVVDIAILFEVELKDLFDIIVVVTAPLENRIQWLKLKRKWTEKEIMDRIQSQMDIQYKTEDADYIIHNSGTIPALGKKIRSLFLNH